MIVFVVESWNKDKSIKHTIVTASRRRAQRILNDADKSELEALYTAYKVEDMDEEDEGKDDE